MNADTSIALGDAGILAPGRWRWARALGWMVALFVGAGLLLAVAPFVRHAAHLPVGGTRALSVATIAVVYLAYWFAVRFGEQRRAEEIEPRALLPQLCIGLLIGAGMFALVFASLRLIGVYTLAPGQWSDWGSDVVKTLATGFVEEMLLRAIVFRLLMRAFGVAWALGLSALLFGVLHLLNPNATWFAALAIAIEAGLMLAAFYLLTGRLWMSVGVHAAWNFMQGPFFGARVSGGTETGSLFTSGPVAGAPALLSGGAFGPEASLSAIVVGLVVFVLVWRAAQGASRNGWASAR